MLLPMDYMLDVGLNHQINYSQPSREHMKIQQEQVELEWKQLYYGQLTSAWATSITTSNAAIKGIVFYSRVILLIWQAIIAQWNLHNQHLHPKNTTE